MRDYIIYTDSSCDIQPAMLDTWGVRYVSMRFSFVGEDAEYRDEDMEITAFYQKMREGGIAKTSTVNPEDYKAAFETALQEGKDVLYIGLSGALSSSFQASRLAAAELKERYPERKIILVDSFSASAGEGMLVYFGVQKKAAGASIEETEAYLNGIKLHICHWFVVDDLDYLKRGGRISPAVAFAGKLLSIKPILHVTEDGVPINVSKVRGTKAAIRLFSEKFAARQLEDGPVFLSHADNPLAADMLSDEIKARFGVKIDLVTHIGTVLGAHTGPGAMAFYFLDRER